MQVTSMWAMRDDNIWEGGSVWVRQVSLRQNRYSAIHRTLQLYRETLTRQKSERALRESEYERCEQRHKCSRRTMVPWIS